MSFDVITYTAVQNLKKTIAYKHVQSTASDTWVIVHNMGRKPGVSIIDSAGSDVQGDVQHDSNNQVTISFAAGFSGEAHLT